MRIVTVATAAMLAAAAPSTAQETSELDTFARAATQNSLTEVLMSAMALQKTGDMRVSEHAWTMLDHHSRAIGDLADVLDADSTALPSTPDTEQIASLDRLRELEGAEFDEAYLAHQLESHASAIQLFEGGSELADEDVANYARVTLPVLEAHLTISRYRAEQDPQPMPGN